MNTLNWKGKGAMSNSDRLHNIIDDITRKEQLIGKGGVQNMKPEDARQLRDNRKALLSHILEMYSSWGEDGDSLPQWVQVGAFNPFYIRLTMTKRGELPC